MRNHLSCRARILPAVVAAALLARRGPAGRRFIVRALDAAGTIVDAAPPTIPTGR